MPKTYPCPICQTPEAVISLPSPQATAHVTCFRCGTFYITHQAGGDILGKSITPRQHSIMSSAIREKGEGYEIDSDMLEQLFTLKDKPPLDKLDLLLLYIYKVSENAGSPFIEQKFELQRSPARPAFEPPLISQDGYAMMAACWAIDIHELISMYALLREQGYLMPKGADNKWAKTKLTTKGFERIAMLQHDKGEGKQVFVAMWFHKETEHSYNEAIEPAIEDAGYTAKRIDRTEHVNKIDDEIIMEIRRSRFVIADFTGQRGGVYYEAGFAKGLDLPVIWACREDHIEGLHFDIRQYNCLIWSGDNLKKYREDIHKRIEAIIGHGPA